MLPSTLPLRPSGAQPVLPLWLCSGQRRLKKLSLLFVISINSIPIMKRKKRKKKKKSIHRTLFICALMHPSPSILFGSNQQIHKFEMFLNITQYMIENKKTFCFLRHQGTLKNNYFVNTQAYLTYHYSKFMAIKFNSKWFLSFYLLLQNSKISMILILCDLQ